jgi:hypothetical protein
MNVETKGKAKNIAPEMLSQKFLLSPEYHQYDDWKQLMEQTYDNFNLMVKPDHSGKVHLNFDPRTHKRNPPKGIFPLPNKKRIVLRHNKQLGDERIHNHD